MSLELPASKFGRPVGAGL